MSSKCKSCGAELRWVEMVSGKRMPLDAEPSPFAGTVMIASDGKGEVVTGEARKIAKEEGQKLYTSHFASCPGAGQHRKKA